jgi:hypothetical protein
VFGIAPICKKPHRMVAKQLAELKDQIKELLEKGYIRPTSPLWGGPISFHPKEEWYSMYVRVLSCFD